MSNIIVIDMQNIFHIWKRILYEEANNIQWLSMGY